MKRCWFGLGLLMALLIGGLLVTRVLADRHSRLSAMLDRAAAAAEAGEWAEAEDCFRQARQSWEKNWHFSAAFVDHDPMEDIDSIFAQAEVFLRSRDPVAMAAVCRQLARLTAAIGEAHIPNWWNLL